MLRIPGIGGELRKWPGGCFFTIRPKYMTIRLKSFSRGCLLADICTQQTLRHRCPVKMIIMIRICFTVIAYIISFLSHSNELDTNTESEMLTQQRNQIEYIAETDSIKEENELEINHLN